MHVSRSNLLLDRFTNYSQEKTSIQRKLQNPDVVEEKKERLSRRLKDIEERLMPQISRKLT